MGADGWKTGKIPRSDHRSLNISLNKEVDAPKTCQSKVQVAEKWNCVQLPSGRPDQPSRQSGEARSRLQNLRTRRCRYCHGHLQGAILLRTVMMMTAGTWSCEIMEFVKNGEQDQTNCWLDVEGEVDVIDHGQDGQQDESKTGFWGRGSLPLNNYWVQRGITNLYFTQGNFPFFNLFGRMLEF